MNKNMLWAIPMFFFGMWTVLTIRSCLHSPETKAAVPIPPGWVAHDNVYYTTTSSPLYRNKIGTFGTTTAVTPAPNNEGIYEFFSSEDPDYLGFVGNHVRARIDEKEHAIHILKGMAFEMPAPIPNAPGPFRTLTFTSVTTLYSNPSNSYAVVPNTSYAPFARTMKDVMKPTTVTTWTGGDVGPWEGEASSGSPDTYVTKSEVRKIVHEEITKWLDKPNTYSTQLLEQERLYGLDR